MGDQRTDDVVDEQVVEEMEAPVDETALGGEEIVSDDDFEADEGPGIFHKFLTWYVKHRKRTLPATGALLLVIVFVAPVSRYAILGLVIKKTVSVTVLDAETNVPVSGVSLSLRGKNAETDGEGKATLTGVKVGSSQLTARKKYYQAATSQNFVGLSSKPHQIKLVATGRQIPVHVTNRITGQNISDAKIKALDTEVLTDQSGEATIVLPTNQQKIPAEIIAKGFNTQQVEISTTGGNQASSNSFGIIPNGKVYFLSKQSGKIDVVKTDLDGGNRQTALAGTGSEEDNNTVLIASKDSRYLALLSRRSGSGQALYLIDTSNDSLTEMDSGNATFSLIGWSDQSFVYQVNRNGMQPWQSKINALKSYNAPNKKLTTLDETNAEGSHQNDYAAEQFGSAYIYKDKLVYAKQWHASYYSVYRLAGKRMGIYSVKPSANNKQTIKDFDVGNNGYINLALFKPAHLYIAAYNATTSFYEYIDSKLQESKAINEASFGRSYPLFLLSSSGSSTFWAEPRDGKNTLFVGNSEGAAPKEISSLSEYRPFGWFGDDYVLLSKNGSELYVQPSAGVGLKGKVLKVSDYHRPEYGHGGY